MENVTLKGIAGTWYEINRGWIQGTQYIIFESEQEGEDLPCIATDADLKIIILDCYNGLDDVRESLE